MSRLFGTLSIAVATLLCGSLLQAHGSTKPQHGGITVVSGELVVELVVAADKTEVYVTDDGDNIDSSAYTARLSVTQGGKVADSELKAAGGNKFVAAGVSVTKGASVVVKIKQADQPQQFATFQIK